jgi:hypothetical protein
MESREWKNLHFPSFSLVEKSGEMRFWDLIQANMN